MNWPIARILFLKSLKVHFVVGTFTGRSRWCARRKYRLSFVYILRLIEASLRLLKGMPILCVFRLNESFLRAFCRAYMPMMVNRKVETKDDFGQNRILNYSTNHSRVGFREGWYAQLARPAFFSVTELDRKLYDSLLSTLNFFSAAKPWKGFRNCHAGFWLDDLD